MMGPSAGFSGNSTGDAVDVMVEVGDEWIGGAPEGLIDEAIASAIFEANAIDFSKGLGDSTPIRLSLVTFEA
jgi:hypothetical protein